MDNLQQLVMSKAEKWLGAEFDEVTRQEVKNLIDNNPKELIESFYKDLEFGTGGLRGIMGVGSNRMNIYTVGSATQADIDAYSSGSNTTLVGGVALHKRTSSSNSTSWY